MAKRLALWLAPVPALLLVTLLLVIPVAEMISTSFHREEFGAILPGFTLVNYIDLLTRASTLEMMASTLAIALTVTVITIVLGFPVAAVVAMAPARWRGTLYFLVAAPLLVNTVVRTYGWLLILGRKGLVNETLAAMNLISEPLALSGNALGMTIGGAQVFLPFMVLSLVTSLMAIDNRLYEAGEILGAGPVRRFFTVTLPLTMPGLIAGSVLVFSMMLGAFVTPLILGGSAVKYVSVAVYTDALVLFNMPRATTLSLILMVIVLGLYLVQQRYAHRNEGRR
ncbi:ABC transporter permease [Ochrobactrum sp. Q0168]|uniref:ABC transporter permease n=1 Tax=Ochrobactrum sp. Q0168 TaxID=2793241 RepID=UPI0018EE0C40|nr:ABC transporter permease [Ochrobactrum sp. Q0168]